MTLTATQARVLRAIGVIDQEDRPPEVVNVRHHHGDGSIGAGPTIEALQKKYAGYVHCPRRVGRTPKGCQCLCGCGQTWPSLNKAGAAVGWDYRKLYRAITTYGCADINGHKIVWA